MTYITEASPAGVDLTQLGAGNVLFVNPTTTPGYPLGMKVRGNDGTYQYVQASGTVALYDLVKISNTFTIASGTTTLLPNTEPAKCGVANQTAFTANQYGWVFVGPGKVTVNVAASCVQDVKLYTTGVAGVVDDSATTLVNGLKLITTIVGAAASPCIAECELGTVLA
jgi:hypothetical protein